YESQSAALQQMRQLVPDREVGNRATSPNTQPNPHLFSFGASLCALRPAHGDGSISEFRKLFEAACQTIVQFLREDWRQRLRVADRHRSQSLYRQRLVLCRPLGRVRLRRSRESSPTMAAPLTAGWPRSDQQSVCCERNTDPHDNEPTCSLTTVHRDVTDTLA